MTAGVHDGVNVRHLCCSVHECQDALPSQRDYFCLAHANLINQCCIVGCKELAQPGFRTCTVEAHRAFQKHADMRNSAMFQLRARLNKANISDVPLAGSSSTSMPTPSSLPPSLVVPDSQSQSNETAPPPVASLPVKGKLSRSWTHNEQLFVRCCGVITSRATLFGSEAITGVKVCNATSH